MQMLTEILTLLFLALGCTWLVVDLYQRTRRLVPPPTPTQVTPAPAHRDSLVAPPTPPAPPSVVQDAPAPRISSEKNTSEVPAPHRAVIAAVVHHLFRGRAQITALRATEAPGAPIDWAREGRRDIFASHRVR
jgi:hypothetical protein